MMSRKMVKVLCVIMAALMLLSVGAVLLQVFAVDATVMPLNAVVPDTGDSAADYILPAGLAVAAVLAIVICVALPKMKKDDGENKQ